MEILGVIGIFLAIIAIIYLSVRGLNIVIAAPLATLIVILTNQMDIFGSLIGDAPSYMTGLAGFLIKNFAIFLLGAVLAQYMEKSNATVSIANWVLAKVGLDNPFIVLVAFAGIAAILTYGGISLFVVMFALVPLARPIFKKLNVNWSLLPIPLFLGMATVTMSMLPGTPSVQNAVPTTYLGTTLTAAPVLSMIGVITVVAFGLTYLKFQLNRSLAKGETFYSYLDEGESVGEEADLDAETDEENIPPILLAILPLVTLVAIILIFSDVPNIILIALTVGILLSAFLYRKYLPKQTSLLNDGANSAVPSAFATSSSVAFGSVLTSAPGFSVVQDAIMSIPGNPLIGLSVATALLGGITGSSSGALGIVMQNFAPTYLEMGIAPELIHRIAVVASAVITVVPHSGVTITFNNLTGLSLKNAFMHQFIMVNGGHLLALIAMLIASTILY
ncbi:MULTISPECIES: GntP family permease [Aerococcus]|uniref:GntP family permease n=1 Tax=Aerococcus TaxID=1375 RepID=UPI0018A7AB36|nr:MULTISPECIES: GntP family permease [Aerococcus]MCY3035815.1 GntP family permease [Aerococcus sp. Group 2]MCY3038910.1 GntP family permease [Aerococcus sp. Group 2]MCY3040482.1 GntP family permease [Aerococcus sp. Group 2]MCY3042479.1 GntP family permease [Aerococcus sp. Group 2]MDK6519927.1 GntP family permease [Aerococcus urinae]